ncbi:uncharacterized protein [Pyxicephalus adspersus]|uniref:uncharacterized protein n=1 Tax=Pyxicephalus adspersus TaxID=30357 RepID=UPI003B5CF0FC
MSVLRGLHLLLQVRLICPQRTPSPPPPGETYLSSGVSISSSRGLHLLFFQVQIRLICPQRSPSPPPPGETYLSSGVSISSSSREDFSVLRGLLLLQPPYSLLQVNADIYELKFKPAVFDDQYIGCVDKLSNDVIPRILKKEKANQQFKEAWTIASKQWNKVVSKLDLPDEFEDEHGIALLVYTNEIPKDNPIDRQLNGNLTIAANSTKDYMEKFHFKALHFYLTRALQILKPDCRLQHVTFRGSWDTFNASPLFKFGRFTSSSMHRIEAKNFGLVSFFQITSCFGANITDFSFFPKEAEVLIPPTEKFTYVMKKSSTYILQSTGQSCSYFNCAIMGGEKQTEALCHSDFNSKNIEKKKKVSAPPAEHEERIAALEALAIRNHEEWDKYREEVASNTLEVKLFAHYKSLISLVYTDVEELKTLYNSLKGQQTAYSGEVEQTIIIMNLLLKQELVDRQQLKSDTQRLDKVLTQIDDIRQLALDVDRDLRFVEQRIKTDGMRVSDVRETISHNLKMLDILQENLRILQASRDDLSVTVQNLTLGLTVVTVIVISAFINRFRSISL